jgi:insertion element IS1 protein InsB
MIEHNRLRKLDIGFYDTSEMDEFWSFVGNKTKQRWTWYAMDKNSGIILA